VQLGGGEGGGDYLSAASQIVSWTVVTGVGLEDKRDWGRGVGKGFKIDTGVVDYSDFGAVRVGQGMD